MDVEEMDGMTCFLCRTRELIESDPRISYYLHKANPERWARALDHKHEEASMDRIDDIAEPLLWITRRLVDEYGAAGVKHADDLIAAPDPDPRGETRPSITFGPTLTDMSVSVGTVGHTITRVRLNDGR